MFTNIVNVTIITEASETETESSIWRPFDSTALTILLITLLVVCIVIIIVLVLYQRKRTRTKTGFVSIYV